MQTWRTRWLLIGLTAALGWVIDHFAYDLLWTFIEERTGVKQTTVAAAVAAHFIPFAIAALLVWLGYLIGRHDTRKVASRPVPIDLDDPKTVPIRHAHLLSLKPSGNRKKPKGLIPRIKLLGASALRRLAVLLKRVLRYAYYLTPGLIYEVPEPEPSRDRRTFNQMRAQSEFFGARFADAFPAARSLVTFTNKRGIRHRLTILMRNPLSATMIDGFSQQQISPIWFTRGHQNMNITRWEKTKPSVFLMNEHELEITKVLAIPGRAYWQRFVYVECAAQKPVGIFRYTPDEISQAIEELGYFDEEYSIYNFRAITISEDDDGAYVRRGRVRRFKHARDRRVRNLSKFNFLIVQGTSPALAQNVDEELEVRLNACLKDAEAIAPLMDWLLHLPKNPAAEIAERA